MKTDPGVAAYVRNAAVVTDEAVTAPKKTKVGGLFKKMAPQAARHSARAERDAQEVIEALESVLTPLESSLRKLRDLRRARLLGKPEEELKRCERTRQLLGEARDALEAGDLGECGKAVRDAARELAGLGGPLTIALNQDLAQAAFSREKKAALEENVARRREARSVADQAEGRSPREALLAAGRVYPLVAEGLELAAEILSSQSPSPAQSRAGPTNDDPSRPISPQQLETFADVGGLEEVKERLSRSIGVMMERSGDKGTLVINGVLLHGPPGTGKTLLARAVAGEYGLRLIRFSPAAIASAYLHEPAAKLRELFGKAAAATPCLLFLDEIDAIAPRREGSGLSADQREIVTQLLTSLEEYRNVPGLIIMAATNTLDHLDPALREGRFDVRIAVPLPDLEARKKIMQVQLERSGLEIDWDAVDLEELAHQTVGRSGAAIASLVAGAAERSLSAGTILGQSDLLTEMEARSGQDRAQTYEDQVRWDDVVLPPDVRKRLQEILLVFQKPELGRKLGVTPPAGILLYGPPGTGKTTIAKALASEIKSSFYEQSAADLLSKWVGESEQKVAQLFNRARSNRPSIIFIDEIDALLKRRQTDSSAPWEERVVSQFLRELDGLHTGTGVLLVGATNRVDIIDEAIRERRMVPINVPLPDQEARAKLMEVLCRDVALAGDVDFREIAGLTEGFSGAEIKSLRNSAGMKALTKAALSGESTDVAVRREDFMEALAERKP